MTPPRATGFGALSWLWWPVVFVGWGLCAVPVVGPPAAGMMMAVVGAAAGWVEGTSGGRGGPSWPRSSPSRLRAPRARVLPVLALLGALAGLSALTACAGADENLAAARLYCLGDGAPPAPGASTSGGDLASCQAIVAGRYGRGAPR